MHGAVGIAIAASASSRGFSLRRRRGYGGGNGGDKIYPSKDVEKLLKRVIRNLKEKQSFEFHIGNIPHYDYLELEKILPTLGYEVKIHRSRKNNLLMTVKKTQFLVQLQSQRLSKILKITSVIIGAFIVGAIFGHNV